MGLVGAIALLRPEGGPIFHALQLVAPLAALALALRSSLTLRCASESPGLARAI